MINGTYIKTSIAIKKIPSNNEAQLPFVPKKAIKAPAYLLEQDKQPQGANVAPKTLQQLSY
ncbi:hypothetical protein [Lentilactobacillus rapi]|uniref:hypothetical protein n=1 Tax=Lentilactobacillus rapi TaxID=481723 RepID=UPI001FB3BE50|nr:hypothetical protein [Lentilactobacillus rapi]